MSGNERDMSRIELTNLRSLMRLMGIESDYTDHAMRMLTEKQTNLLTGATSNGPAMCVPCRLEMRPDPAEHAIRALQSTARTLWLSRTRLQCSTCKFVGAML